MTTLATLQAAHESTPHGDLAGAYRSAVAYLADAEPSYRPNGKTEAGRLDAVARAQGVSRRRQAWERSTMTGLAARVAKTGRKAAKRGSGEGVQDPPPTLTGTATDCE